MNIVITLPADLIAAIKNGKKCFELRSILPRYFDPNKDVVFVCQKGAKEVPISFTIYKFYYYGKDSDCNYMLAERAGVPVEWVRDYMSKHGSLYAWVIGYIVNLHNPAQVWSDLDIKSNPQSFIYKQLDWRQLVVDNYSVSSFITYSDMQVMMHPNKSREDYLHKQKKAVQ